MNVVETEWWILDLPVEWQAEQEDETIIISDEDGVGELAITTLEKQGGVVSDQELLALAEELVDEYGSPDAVNLAELTGFYFSYNEEGLSLRDWYLKFDNKIILITYSCELENSAMDDAAVNEILSTFFMKEDD